MAPSSDQPTQLSTAQAALTVSGSMTMQHTFGGGAAIQVAADRLEEVQYAKATCTGDQYKGEFVTASVTPTSALNVNLARVSDWGNFTNEGSTWSSSSAVKKAAVAGIDRGLFAVATRNGDDTFTLRVFDASSGSPTQLATYSSTGDTAVAKVADLAVARVPVYNSGNTSSTADSTTDTNLVKLVIPTATTAGSLQVNVFDVDKSTGAVTRQNTGGCCVAATKVAVAVPGRPQGMFVIGSLDGSGNVIATNWQINDSGQMVQRSIVQMPGSGGYTDVTAAAAGYRRAAIYASGSLSATLATFDITGQWDLSTMAVRSTFPDSNPIQGATLVSGGSGRLYVVGRRSTAQVIRSYLATTGLLDLDEETDGSFGASTASFSAAVLESSRLVTAGVTAGNTIQLESWRDFHVPVARGFWPTTGTRTLLSPPPPGDNQSTFGFDTGLSATDLSIAASDRYVVTCSYDRCKFLDKAGNSLPAKYSGTGEFTGSAVPLSWEAGAGPGLFDSAVGQPGVSTAPVAEESLLRHLELQHACDPELSISKRNMCPTESYDSSVTYDLFLQRFVIVTQFRYASGCGDPTGRYPAIAVSKTTDPRDGFFVYVSLERGGRDMPRVSAQNGMAIVNWNGGGGFTSLQMNGMVWELADLIGTPKASPRVTKIDQRQIPADGYQPPIAASGDAPVGFVVEHNRHNDSDTTLTVWSFPKTTVGPVAVTRHDFRMPWQMNSGEIGVDPGVAKFKQVAPGLFDGHLYLAGQRSNKSELRLVDLNVRYSSSTNDLWLVGSSRQAIPCVHPVSGQSLSCLVYGPIVDSQGRVVLDYTSLARSGDIGPDGYAATSYALLQTPLAPPSLGVLKAGDQYNDQSTNGIDLDFVIGAPDPTNGFWTIGGRSKGTGYAASAGRVFPPAIPAYTGIGRLWAINSAGTDLAPSYAWQDETWAQYKQVVHGDFDGDHLEDLFLYNDKTGEGRLYKVGDFALGAAIGPVTTGLSATLNVVAVEVCGGSGQLCPGSVSNSTRELLFYDWAKGDASFYRVDASTHALVKIASNATRNTWTVIANGDYTTDGGEELLFYDPTKSEVMFYAISSSGLLTSGKSNILPELGADATAIIAGEFDPDTQDEVYVYTPLQAKGRFYKLDNTGAMTQTGADQPTRATWTQVAVMSNGWTTLVHYDPSLPPASGGTEPTSTGSDGTLRFTSVASGAFVSSSDALVRGTGNGRDWNEMLAGHFRNSSAQDVLFHRLIAPAPAPCTVVDGVCRRQVTAHPEGCRASDGAAYMTSDQGLYPNQFMLSCDGRFRLYLQGDGNLVLSMKDSAGNFSTALWTSKTSGLVVDILYMQSDGNLVMYNPDGAPVWSTGTNGKPGLHLKMYNDGNMKLYDSAFGTAWQTNTGGH